MFMRPAADLMPFSLSTMHRWVVVLTDFFLMPRDYFLVFLTFFPPAFMLTCSLIQPTSSVSSAYLLLIMVQNVSTLISSVMGLVISVK